MKKITVLVLSLTLSCFLFADFDFYGNARMGLWYQQSDEDYTEGEARWDMNYDFYTNSRFGATYDIENYNAGVEFGFKSGDVSLRKIYGEYDFKKFSLLIGQTYTGFSDLSKQASSVDSGLDGCFIGYGCFYDSRSPMIKFSFKNGLYVMLMDSKKDNPFGDESVVDALVPKINIGYKYEKDNLYIHPTFGINFSQFNKDYATWEEENPDYDPADSTSMEYITKFTDEEFISYAFAVTFQYTEGDICFKAQINGGQNIGNYGMKSSTVADAVWDDEKDEVIDVTSYGGYGQFGYKIDDKTDIKMGVGYTSSEIKGMKNQDTGMSAYFQTNYKLADKITLTPEIGIFDDMEDGYGKVEGSRIYVGTKLQVDFP